MVFLDTNILLYASSKAEADKEKRQIARDLILSNDFIFSTQVVQEYIANALRKPKLNIGEKGVERFLQTLDDLQVVPVTLPLLQQAWQLKKRYSLSHWDASILAAAIESSCDILYSEDFQNGFVLGNTNVINPFAD
ncbi:MAG: PIN domain-containing protein [Verrucomicrobia bacterium]|nr:PIN domain-containing protein [Verrucomicrobiota bacterium]MCH8526051.1 PIN domain-containing protein [Kiritimatiellia bacterium]